MGVGVNDTDVEALVDTTRDELRERISQALTRFERVARAADPLARPPGSKWNVQQTVAHVLNLVHRYLGVVEGTYRLADTPGEVTAFNQCELDAVMAPTADLVDQLHAVAPSLDALFDSVADEGRVLGFHCHPVVDGSTWQSNWLGELLMHGQDIARAAKVPWEMTERDMLLIARGMMQIAPAFVDKTMARDLELRVIVQIPTARPYLIHVHDVGIELRPSRPGDQADAVLRLPASTFALMLYKRVGPVGAVGKGLRIVGGRRPWRALKMQSCYVMP